MRMFLYYAFHSVKNQLKKLFKTWVLIFILACFLFGGIIGLGAGLIFDETETEGDSSYSAETEEEITEEAFVLPADIENPETEFVELIVGGLGLIIVLCFCFSADKSGNAIFLPADVNLLFSAPLRPQTVLMFRLTTQIAAILLSSIYISFNIPNLVLNLGLSVWTAVGFIIALISIMALGKLLQILLYLIASTKPFIKKNLRVVLFGVILLIAALFYGYTKALGNVTADEYFVSAFRFFNHPATRFVPIIGCLKMFCVHIVEGNILGIFINLIGIILTGVLLCVAIYKVKVDFYEEAMAKSEETAQLQQIAQEQQGFAKRKKDRSERIKRSGLERGNGADIFFWKSMYNRFRFAHFKVFTKTSETYLLTTITVILVCKLLLDANGFIVNMLIIGGFAFFRTLGNPLEEDTSKDFFRLVPEKTVSKLFWSVTAGTVNCLLDIFPAVLLSAIAFGANPLTIIPWMLFIISIDFYGTTTGAFINISVPVNAGKVIKQLIQIMFIYFGLLPDFGILIAGYLMKGFPIALVISAIVNLLIGALFLVLTPAFMDFKEKAPVIKQ